MGALRTAGPGADKRHTSADTFAPAYTQLQQSTSRHAQHRARARPAPEPLVI
jgi:hypothetical protein